ncbi:MAG: hypothetical protein RL385_1007 [Pseudomonadota bacterium]|jgi:hypothetical protein
MVRSTYPWSLTGLVLLFSCAESAVDSEYVPEAPEETAFAPLDASALASLDADLGADEDAAAESETPDAAAARADAAAADGGRDAGQDAGVDAGRDASVKADASAGSPAKDAGAVDAGERDAGPASTSDAGPEGCPVGQVRCGAACIDTRADPEHCGSCDFACSGADECSESQCVAPAVPSAQGCTGQSFNGHGYLFCTTTLDWFDARMRCLRAGLDLAVPNDAAENDFIHAHLNNGRSWLGVTDRDLENRFSQVGFGDNDNTAGGAVSFSPWARNEPSNAASSCLLGGIICSGDEDCVEMYADGTWNDHSCDVSHAYVCEAY